MNKKPGDLQDRKIHDNHGPWTKHWYALLLSNSDLWRQHFHRPYDPAAVWYSRVNVPVDTI